MKTASKKEVVTACRELAKGYNSLQGLDHRFDTCPMCKLFYNDSVPSRFACSGNCPNMAFKTDANNYGCLDRQDKHNALNWNESGGNARLAIYWTRIGNYLSKQNPEDVENLSESDRIKSHIVKTAKEIDQKEMD